MNFRSNPFPLIGRLSRIVFFLVAACVFFASSVAQAHFIWVYAEGDQVKIVFGEELEPDQAQFLQGLDGIKAWKTEDGELVPLHLIQKTEDSDGWFEALAKKPINVDTNCLYGVFEHGNKSMLLDYSARYINLATEYRTSPTKNLTLDVIPTFSSGQLQLSAWFQGVPIANAEIEVSRVAFDDVATVTNDAGQATIAIGSRYVIRAKHVVKEAGEHDGKSYNEKRYYCTLVLDVTGNEAAVGDEESSGDTPNANGQSSTGEVANTNDEKTKTSATVKAAKIQLEDLPIGLTSFGAAVSGDQLYVIGGKIGPPHEYAKNFQSRKLYSLDLSADAKSSDPESPTPWQEVSECDGLQGLALVAHNGSLYRIGGMVALNEEDEDEDIRSTTGFARFDIKNGTWTELPELPQPRSSLDAWVVGDVLYVAGGWNLLGEKDESEWAETALKFNLADPNAKWESFPVPFHRRAIALVEHQNRLYAIGGMNDSNPSANVDVFDVASGKWSTGPKIPTTGGMKAFGCGAAVVGGKLLVTTYDGGVYQLSQDGDSWEQVHKFKNGRFFHRMVPHGDDEFILIGGAHMAIGKILETSAYRLVPHQN